MRTENEISDDSVEERGIPSAARRNKSRVKTLAVVGVIVALMCAMAAFAAMEINRFTKAKMAEKVAARKEAADRRSSASTDDPDLSGQMARIKADEAARAASEASMAVPADAAASTAAAIPLAQGGRSVGQHAVPGLSLRDQELYSDQLLVLPASETTARRAGQANAVQDGVAATLDALKQATGGGSPGLLAGAKSSNGNPLENSLQPSDIEAGKASLLPNLDYLLKRGTLIPCGVLTRVDTTWPGGVKCVVTEDVYSANGHTLLIRKGASAFGEQRQALVQGKARIAVLWDEIDDGPVKIAVDSPAADSLGAAGIPANVDNHFWQRFGGAVLISVVGDFSQALSQKTVGGGTSAIALSGSNDSTSVVEEILRGTINIPPTAYSNQGTNTNIFVVRHIDMSSVYAVVKTDGSEQ